MTLVNALDVAKAIQNYNAGKPYARLDLAKALSKSPTSSGFQKIITASGQFGLTTGSFRAENISLTELGKSIVAPKNPDERGKGLREALLSIEVFRQFFEKYNNERLPEVEFVQNTLERDFEIPAKDVKACYKMIVDNAKELKMLEDISGSTYVRLSKLGGVTPVPRGGEESLIEVPDAGISMPEEPPVIDAGPVVPTVPKVFVSHGKNKKIVKLVQQILDYGGFEPVVAVQEETIAVPVSDKVLDSMRQCQFGLMNISLDKREKREDGSFGVNQNVLIEIGAAFVLYNKQVILLSDKRVTIPSNIEGLYRCEYEGDELDGATTMKLLKTLTKFREPLSD
jgi:mRNA-degrading endonuclease HigB of HigAB toxin-antitoxin module